ncbi:uncharacterized protein LOC116302465 isoform X2 [Actinia tenebrosa]|uniref:Uncharacterized protein LOC116302465 isoform X2 n=1 Tax=Actinia tenebrosa TaxID=6105 RepID=A0A6P8IKY5_ACTTE|nr:uncharacterized protein LOC116302465 isoform X2 [Actinia tenebrosa]
MSRQIPIFVEPGYETTFNESRRSSDPMGGDTRHGRHLRFDDTPRIEEEFEDATNRFFEKNLRRRHNDFPDPAYCERDFQSHSPPRHQERPFRRGLNPSDFFFESPSRRRGHFDEMIQRMMREDSDSFDFSEPEFGNFHVEKTTGKRHSPEVTRKNHGKVTKTPSAPVSGERNKGKFGRQSSNPSSGSAYIVDDGEFVDIPVVVSKDEKAERKVGKDEKEKLEKNEAKDESVTQENARGEVTENEKDEIKRESENDSELEIKSYVDTTEEKNNDHKEGKAKIDDNNEKKDVESQGNVQSEKSKSEQETEGNQMPQESQQNAQMPESQQHTQIPLESQQNAEVPLESQQNAQLSKIKIIEDELKNVVEKVRVFEPNGSKENNKEYLWLEEKLMRILMGLDAIEANGSKEIRGARKAVVKRVQKTLNELETKSVS